MILPTTRTEPTYRTNEMNTGSSEEGNMQQQRPKESMTCRYVVSKNRIVPQEINDATINSSSEHSSEYRSSLSMSALGSSYSTTMQPHSVLMGGTTNVEGQQQQQRQQPPLPNLSLFETQLSPNEP
jgi:hypothetical protein